VFTDVRVSEEHWFRFELPLAEEDKPPWTKPTVGVAFEINSDVAPLIEIEAMTGVAPEAELPPKDEAFTRAFVMRMVREKPVVTGARTGMPKNVIEFPATMPWNTLAAAAVVVALAVATATVVPTLTPPGPTTTVPTVAVQPVVGVEQRVCNAAVP
jgi:hypothetical protein